MTLLGGEGLAKMAKASHIRARQTAERLSAIPGVTLVNRHYFNEFAVALPHDARQVVRDLADRQVLGGVSLGRLYPHVDALSGGLLVAATECTADEDIEKFATTLAEVLA